MSSIGIVVKDAYQGKGIGSNLLKRLIDLGRMENVGEIILHVRVDHARAIRLYEKHGFKQVRTIKSGDNWQMKKHDLVEMLLDLP